MSLDERRVRKLIFKAWQVGVASVGFEHMGDEDFVGVREKGLVDFGAADEVDRAADVRKFCEFIRAMDYLRAGCGPVRIAGEHDVAALGQGAADRLKSFAAHHDRVTACGAFEKCEVLGQVPWQRAIAADHAIGGHGDDGDEVHGEENYQSVPSP